MGPPTISEPVTGGVESMVTPEETATVVRPTLSVAVKDTSP